MNARSCVWAYTSRYSTANQRTSPTGTIRMRLPLCTGIWLTCTGRRSSKRRRERLQDLEAAHAGHLHVQKDEIGMLLFDDLQRLDAVARLADDAHPVGAGEEAEQTVARELLVVHHHRPDGRHVLPMPQLR